MQKKNFLKEKRELTGISQEQLAEKIDVSVRTIQRIEAESELVNRKNAINTYKEMGILREEEIFEFKNKGASKDVKNVLEKLGIQKGEDLLHKLDKKLLLASNYEKDEDFDKAMSIYKSFEDILPCEYIFLRYANIYLNMEICEMALEYSQKVLDEDKTNYEALIIKGISLAKMEEYDEAIMVFKEAEAVDKTEEVYYNLGVCCHFAEKIEDAIEYYKKSLDLNCNLAESYLNLGVCYFYKFIYSGSDENKENCLKYLDKAIELYPIMYKAYVQKAELYKFIGEDDKAKYNFEKCLQLNPTHDNALLGLGMLLIKSGDNKKGEEYVGKAIESILYNRRYKKSMLIGGLAISDGQNELIYPTIGKVCKNKIEFDYIVNKIKSSVELFNLPYRPIYIDFNKSMSVNVMEQQDDILIEINFGGYTLKGTADKGNGCFNEFIELYNNFGQFRIQIESQEQIFIIDSLKDINFISYINSK